MRSVPSVMDGLKPTQRKAVQPQATSQSQILLCSGAILLLQAQSPVRCEGGPAGGLRWSAAEPESIPSTFAPKAEIQVSTAPTTTEKHHLQGRLFPWRRMLLREEGTFPALNRVFAGFRGVQQLELVGTFRAVWDASAGWQGLVHTEVIFLPRASL